MGFQGLINDAYANMPFSNGSRQSGPVAMVPQAPPGPGGDRCRAMHWPSSPLATVLPGRRRPRWVVDPVASAGAAQADFDSLIDLISPTVEYDTWMENGSGEGEIQPFPRISAWSSAKRKMCTSRLSTCLEQLRRLQDLQVTIEVRFIRLTDNFFERIGIDFDFNIEDGSAIADLSNTPGSVFEPNRASATVGISGNPTSLADPLPDFHRRLGCTVPQQQLWLGIATVRLCLDGRRANLALRS